MLTKVLHTKDSCTVSLCIEVAKCKWVAKTAVIYIRAFCWCPLWVGEDVNICLFTIAYCLGVLVHLYIFVRHILEVEHPGIHKVFFALRNEKVSLNHKFRVKTNENSCVIKLSESCLVNSVHNNLIKLCIINARFTLDTASCCVTACYSTVIHQKYLGISVKTELLSSVNREISYDCSR